MKPNLYFQLETNQHKAKKLQEHINSVNDWTTSTAVFVDEFNDVAPQVLQLDDSSEKDKEANAKTEETDAKEGEGEAVGGDDEDKAKQERLEKINTANDIIHKIAVSYQAWIK